MSVIGTECCLLDSSHGKCPIIIVNCRRNHYVTIIGMWKQGIGFHPDMFMNALKETELFKGLSEKEIETKAHELCNKADFAKSMFHAAFELENLSI